MEPEERALYANKETLLNGIRRRVNAQQQSRATQSYSRDENIDNVIREPIPINTRTTFTTDGQRTEETRNDNGGTASNDGTTGSMERTATEERFIAGRVERSDTGPNQYSGNDRGEREDTDITRRSGLTGGKFKFWHGAAQAVKTTKNALADKPSTMAKTKTKVVASTKLLTDIEAARFREPLTVVVTFTSNNMDKFIVATTKGHDEHLGDYLAIWSNMSDYEIGLIVTFLLSRAKVDARAAKAVRELVGLRDKLQLGYIIGLRAYRTLKYYWQTGLSIK